MKMKQTVVMAGIVVAGFMFGTQSLKAGEIKAEYLKSSDSQVPYPALSDDLVNAGSPALAKVLFDDFTPFQKCNAAALNDGTVGMPSSQGSVTFDLDGNWTVTFVLDISKSPNGYDIGEIRTIAGWPPNRACQKFELFVSKVSAPDKFTSMGVFEVDAEGALATQIKLTGTQNQIETNVAAIKFKIMIPESAIKGATATTYREIDVIGSASK